MPQHLHPLLEPLPLFHPVKPLFARNKPADGFRLRANQADVKEEKRGIRIDRMAGLEYGRAMAEWRNIRQARFADTGAIYEVIRENPEEVLPRSYQDIFMHFDRFYVYDDGEVRGVVSWQPLPLINPDQPDPCLEVISFSVRKQDQGRGIGSLLLTHLLGTLKTMAPDRIIVLTFYPDFFRKFGFIETSKERLYQKILFGCLHCTKHKSPLTCPEVAMELTLASRTG
jgi:amino-acid N-acetyltransferase